MERTYKFSIWGTQGGGLVQEVGGRFIFIEKSDCLGLGVGDEMPKEWDIAPANEQARQEMWETDPANLFRS